MIGKVYIPSQCVLLIEQSLNANQFNGSAPVNNRVPHNVLWNFTENKIQWVNTLTGIIEEEADGSSPLKNPFIYFLDELSPDGGDGSVGNPFNNITDAVAAIPTDGKTYDLLVLPGNYNAPSTVNLPNISNLNIIGVVPGNTAFQCNFNLTATNGMAAVSQYRNVALNGVFTIDLALASFASINILNASTQLNRIDTNPSCIVILQSGIFNTTISGSVVINGGVILGDVTVNPNAFLYVANAFMIGGIFKLNGNCTLKTLSTLNPSNGYVDGTVVAGNTPTWLTDAASDAAFTGAVNKTVY